MPSRDDASRDDASLSGIYNSGCDTAVDSGMRRTVVFLTSADDSRHLFQPVPEAGLARHGPSWHNQTAHSTRWPTDAHLVARHSASGLQPSRGYAVFHRKQMCENTVARHA